MKHIAQFAFAKLRQTTMKLKATLALLLAYSPGIYSQTLVLEGRNYTVQTGARFEARGAGLARVPMNFADAIYYDADDWKNTLSRQFRAKSVTLAFTFYPRDTAKWFRPLLAARMRALAHLDSALLSDERIEWKIFFQTEAKNERQARKLFHGAVIEYDLATQARSAESGSSSLPSPYAAVSSRPTPAMAYVLDILNGTAAVDDSTVFKVLDRNPSWKDMVVVVDLTGSMHPYSALLIRWLTLHHAQGKIKHLVFFNDGDDHIRNNKEKKVGQTGGIYHVRPDSMKTILAAMERVIRSGGGGDVAENNLEALLAAIEKYPDEKEYYMIADNTAPVRDIALLNKIKKPVHVIVCRAPHRYDPILNDYVKIAWKTKGSVQLMEKAVSFAKAHATDKFVYVRKNKYEIDPHENFYRR
ncbi:MAG: hypothetical protein RMM53_00660 [Bacteroidia bacterium]|nr:hypothetical protein [Bacteroidia bacterium]MDW8332706.1 hypothetical protein [Bacteroidia bacterium]